MFFSKKIDRRSRQAMIAFLENHFRYDTANSWNRSTSYAQCIKLNHLGLTKEQTERAYDIVLGDTDYWELIRDPIDLFTEAQGGYYTIGSNGRSGGYLVLYESHYESTGHRSYCTCCGQQNYKSVAPNYSDPVDSAIAAEVLRSGGSWRPEVYLGQSAIQALALSDEDKLTRIRRLKGELEHCTETNRCGRCGANARVNYTHSPRRLSVYPGRAIDESEDYSEWSMESLREQVGLVQAFDAACDEIRAAFIGLVDECEVVEKQVMVPKTVKVLQCRTEAVAHAG